MATKFEYYFVAEPRSNVGADIKVGPFDTSEQAQKVLEEFSKRPDASKLSSKIPGILF